MKTLLNLTFELQVSLVGILINSSTVSSEGSLKSDLSMFFSISL
jgi:hypothetical protein